MVVAFDLVDPRLADCLRLGVKAQDAYMRRAFFVTLAMLAACTSAPTEDDEDTKAASPGATGANTAADVAALRGRPWVVPHLTPSAECPVTRAKHRPDPDLGDIWGNGPVGPVGLVDGVLDYVAPDRTGVWRDRGWGGMKVLWAVDPKVAAPVLVRGRQLDGTNEVRFEDPARPELVLDPSEDALPGGWRDYPSYTRLRAPGCYAYQVDTTEGTWTIVFRADGPIVS